MSFAPVTDGSSHQLRLSPLTDPRGSCATRAITIRLGDVQPQPLEWLWPGRVPLGKLTLIAGDPGLGKSLITIDMAARVSTGRAWPDARDSAQQAGSVVLLTTEDDISDTIRPRLDAAEANVDRIIALQAIRLPGGSERAFSLAEDLRHLEVVIEKQGDVRLIVVDPISAYCGKTDSHVNADVRGLLAPLAQMAARYGVAIVVVTHLNKGAGGRAIYRSTGSLAFMAAARAGWLIVADGDDLKRRLMLPVKMNLGPEPTGLAYTVDAVDLAGVGQVASVRWEPDPVTLTADEALIVEHSSSEMRTARQEAADWLRDALADGPLSAEEVKRQASANSISHATLRRAKADVGVKPFKTDYFNKTWYWRLPGDTRTPRCSPISQDAHLQALSTLGDDEHLGNMESQP